MIDFTLNTYVTLVDSLLDAGYTSYTYERFLEMAPSGRGMILRHDVDARNRHSLRFAEIQHKKQVTGTYYFRMTPGSFNEKIIRKISSMGHEIGYHYETMDTCKGNLDKAYSEFCKNLEALRKIVTVRTICMHGSPRSPFDNKEIWRKYHYRDLGIIGEPYFDIDFSKVAYLTDTGRMWNGSSVSVRDKVNSAFHFDFKSTSQIIKHIHQLPDQVMFTFHPQRWTNNPLSWSRELVMQSIKNQVKHALVKR